MYKRITYCKEKRVVGFDFIEDELLLVMLYDGSYFLIDPYDKDPEKKQQVGLSSLNTNVIECKVFGNSFALLV